jgi:hypothetical protein
MIEDYEIVCAKGYQVINEKYYSKVFATIEEAEAHKLELLSTPKRETTIVRKVK